MANKKTAPRSERSGATTKAKKTKAKKRVNALSKAKSAQKMATKAYKRELKAKALDEKKALNRTLSTNGLVARPNRTQGVRKDTAHSLEGAMRSGTATKAQSSAYRATHEASRVQSNIYGTAKRTANAMTKATVSNIPEEQRKKKAVRQEIGSYTKRKI